MKKLLVLAGIAGVLFVLKRNKDAKSEADLWREATAPSDGPLGSASTNGSAPERTSTQGAAGQN
ncbi:MAG: hypothetical protein GEV00_21455 [Actinophytocola sp.]|nr:hypothetical protein [Actinophytocola sp.]